MLDRENFDGTENIPTDSPENMPSEGVTPESTPDKQEGGEYYSEINRDLNPDEETNTGVVDQIGELFDEDDSE